MPRRLKNMAITHISLVKAGANGKSIIYKSADAEPSYAKDISIAKKDDEQGVVWGIVYEPDKVDTQGDSASAEEIKKAAYAFMKARNLLNVDKGHNFQNVDAHVAESWIVRKGDELFPESVGAWAVAIKVESDELKDAIKKGEIKALSMAGTAETETIKDDGDSKNITKILKDALEAVMKPFLASKESINKTDVEKLIKEQFEPLLKAKEKLEAELQKAKDDLAKITTERDNLANEIKKSKQITTPSGVNMDETEEIIKAAQEYIKKEAELGNNVSVADAVMKIYKGDKK
jgi:hypothetical protein